MILATFDSPESVETLLNNLSEAEFNLEDVAVVSSDTQLSEALLPGQSLLQGVLPETVSQSLIEKGISEVAASQCQEAIANGCILVVMNVAEEYHPAAEEVFQDHSAQFIRG